VTFIGSRQIGWRERNSRSSASRDRRDDKFV
jgi:hypothetical protein